eukprot:9223680-Pyramimonas_sp.AAC.1
MASPRLLGRGGAIRPLSAIRSATAVGAVTPGCGLRVALCGGLSGTFVRDNVIIVVVSSDTVILD